METTSSSETSVEFQRTTRRYIPEGSTLHKHRCENLKSYIRVASLPVLQSKTKKTPERSCRLHYASIFRCYLPVHHRRMRVY
jgi:hypothetical protein